MSQEFIDRIFIEIDNTATKLEKIAKITYINSTNIELIKKIIVSIITFIIFSSLGVIYNAATHNIIHKQINKQTLISNIDEEINK